MGISKPVLSVQAATTRADLKVVVVRQGNAIPPTSYLGEDEYGTIIRIRQPAERLGQMMVYRADNDTTRVVTMYVVVEVSPGVLAWAPVQTGVTRVDSRTGQAWDARAAFYDYRLAN